jgi:AraC family transcriptional regulator
VLASMQREQPYEASFAGCADHLVILHLDGQVKVDRWLGKSRESRLITAGGLFMIPSGMDFRVRLNDPLTTIHFYVRHSVIREVAQDLVAGDADHLELKARIGENDPLLERLILSLRDEILFGGDMGEAYVDHIARLAAARLIRSHSTRPERLRPGTFGTSDDQRRIARVTDFVQSNLARSIQLDDMAAAIDVSVSQLMSLFKRVLGQPPHRFLVNLRVSSARHLLASTNLPIAEIAGACGFAHQEHLTRLFRREIGLTPAAYRKSLM